MNQSAAGAAEPRIRIAPAGGPVEVRLGEALLARSENALELFELGHPPRLYLPRADVNLEALTPIDVTTSCPFKGIASDYWALAGDAAQAPLAWSYPEPFPAAAAVAGHVAFYDAAEVVRGS